MAKTLEETGIVGQFGELATAYYLSKLGISVLKADTICFDLFARDSDGVLFPKGRTVGLSVKIRDRSNTTPTCTIERPDFPDIKSHARKWDVEAWIAHLIVSKSRGSRILEGFLIPAREARKYFAGGARPYAISFSSLRKDIDGRFAGTGRYFKWHLD